MYKSTLLENVEVQELLFTDNQLESESSFFGSAGLGSSLASIFHVFIDDLM